MRQHAAVVGQRVVQEEVEGAERVDRHGELVEDVVDRDALHLSAGVEGGVATARWVVELALLRPGHHGLRRRQPAVDARVACGAVEGQAGRRVGRHLLEGLLAHQHLGLALGGDGVDRDGGDPVAVGVVEGGVDEGGVGDVVLGDLPRTEHHLGVPGACRRRGRVAIDGDGRIRLVAAAAIDLRERVGELRGVLDAHVAQRARVGGQVGEGGGGDGPEAAHLDVGRLQSPRVAAGGQVVVDRRRLGDLRVGVDRGALVDRAGDGLDDAGEDQPADQRPGEDRAVGDRGAVAAHHHERRGEHRERQRHPLQGAEHWAGDIALGGVEPDEVVVLGRGQVVDAEVRSERGEDEHPGEADAGVGDRGAEAVLEAAVPRAA